MKKGSIAAIGLIIVAIIVVVAVMTNQRGSSSNQQSDTTSSSSGSGQAGASSDVAATADGITITFTNNGFSPKEYTVKKGQSVTVKNESSSSVQFSSDDHPTHREDPEINMKTLKAGESGTFIPTTVGTHGFHDHIHDEFTGTLIVTE